MQVTKDEIRRGNTLGMSQPIQQHPGTRSPGQTALSMSSVFPQDDKLEFDYLLIYKYQQIMRTALEGVGLESPDELQKKLSELDRLPPAAKLMCLRQFMYDSSFPF